jgi:hypothetical protein
MPEARTFPLSMLFFELLFQHTIRRGAVNGRLTELGEGSRGMLRGLLQRWRPAPLASRGDLADFLDRQAALVAQKSVIGYCQVKTRLPLHELTCEKPFAAAFVSARAEAYAAVLADLVVVAEGLLREAMAPEILAGALLALYEDLLARHPSPRGEEGWGAERAALALRLAAAQAAPPRRVAEVAERSAEHIYATMPIHETLREPDGPAIKAGVQFLLVSLYREFDERLDRAALARAFAG